MKEKYASMLRQLAVCAAVLLLALAIGIIGGLLLLR